MANFDIRTQIDNTENPFELSFRNGDFETFQSDEQNVRLTLMSSKGNWKQYPLIGASLINLLHQTQTNNYDSIVAKELERVGYRLISFTPGESDFSGEVNYEIEIEEID